MQWSLQRNPDIGITTSTVNPVVDECNDGYLNDIQGRHVRAEHVFAALNSATSGSVEEGAVGAGTGMSAFGFKAGVGTASRKLSVALGAFTVGVLLVANFGQRRDLCVIGVPVGRVLASEHNVSDIGDGFVMVVVATDASLAPHPLARLARRAYHGLARTEAVASHGSGDFVLAFSTRNRIAHQPSHLVRTVELVEDNTPCWTLCFLV